MLFTAVWGRVSLERLERFERVSVLLVVGATLASAASGPRLIDCHRNFCVLVSVSVEIYTVLSIYAF